MFTWGEGAGGGAGFALCVFLCFLLKLYNIPLLSQAVEKVLVEWLWDAQLAHLGAGWLGSGQCQWELVLVGP